MSDDVKHAIEALRRHNEAEPDSESKSAATPKSSRGREKRLHTRFRVNFPVHIRLSDGDVARARAVNLSQGGIYIEYGTSADEGREFDMLFDLNIDDTFRRVYVRAKVVRSLVIGDRDVYGIAFSFTRFAKDSEQILEKYLHLRELKQF